MLEDDVKEHPGGQCSTVQLVVSEGNRGLSTCMAASEELSGDADGILGSKESHVLALSAVAAWCFVLEASRCIRKVLHGPNKVEVILDDDNSRGGC
jgi:hypothetical protein